MHPCPVPTPVKVHLYGSENNGWALDADLATTRQALERMPDLVTLTSLARADVVYAVWEYPLFQMDRRKLEGKRVICQICNDFMRIHEDPCMIRARDTIGLWVAMTGESRRAAADLGYPHAFVPYAVDTAVFTPRPDRRFAGEALRGELGIPSSAFVVSNFMRDSRADDIMAPKRQKGTEMLLQIALEAAEKKLPVHFLLAGPRRHWIRSQLRKNGIPFTFVGRETVGDDNDVNILPADTVNRLYHISDLHLVTSRWEGGPRAVLESAATRTPILSTPVGLAPDILSPESLFTSVDEAVEKVGRRVHGGASESPVDRPYARLTQRHTPAANLPRFRKLFTRIGEVAPLAAPRGNGRTRRPGRGVAGRIAGGLGKLVGRVRREGTLGISLWHEFHKPPYGGGNQFMMALRDALERQGVRVYENRFAAAVDVHICNSAWFDRRLFERKARQFPLRMIHRIDGPTTLYRGLGREEDDRIFALNRQFASATVFQSAFCFRESCKLGYEAVSPVIIHNAVNAGIFHPGGKRPFRSDGKTRLVSSAWSDNPLKGGPFLKWIDGHLDWERFEYTFVGRVKETFDHIRHLPPRDSGGLAALLREHDIFVSVSHNEPCSNALVEAMACGLPSLYRNEGGNAELVGFGGLPFAGETDFLSALDRMVAWYGRFQSLIALQPIDDIASRYVGLAREILRRH